MHDPLIHFPAAAVREGTKEKGPNQVDSGLSRYYCEVGENIGEL
jgi:hypothetical protein